jgi:hypothetical protein
MAFQLWIKSSTHPLTTGEIMHQLSSLLWYNELHDWDRVVILMFSAFDPEALSNSNCLLCRDILQQVIVSSADRDAVLKGAELLAVTHTEEILPKISILLKQCYDLDLVGEDEILKWYGDLTSSLSRNEASTFVKGASTARSILTAIRQKATPLITWLQQAETDDES